MKDIIVENQLMDKMYKDIVVIGESSLFSIQLLSLNTRGQILIEWGSIVLFIINVCILRNWMNKLILVEVILFVILCFLYSAMNCKITCEACSKKEKKSSNNFNTLWVGVLRQQKILYNMGCTHFYIIMLLKLKNLMKRL